MKQFSWQKLVAGIALAVSCMVVGATISSSNRALGEVTAGAPEPPAFQNGSVPILKEILRTLHQMDARVARLESVAQKMAARSAMSAQRAAPVQPTEEGLN